MWINTRRHYDHLHNGHDVNHRNRKTGHWVPLPLTLWDHIFFHALDEAHIPHTLFPWAMYLAVLHRPLLGKHPPPPRARPFCVTFSTSRSCCTLVQPPFPTSTSGDHREMLCLQHFPPRTTFIFRLLWLWMRHLTTMPSQQLLYSLQKPFPPLSFSSAHSAFIVHSNHTIANIQNALDTVFLRYLSGKTKWSQSSLFDLCLYAGLLGRGSSSRMVSFKNPLLSSGNWLLSGRSLSSSLSAAAKAPTLSRWLLFLP